MTSEISFNNTGKNLYCNHPISGRPHVILPHSDKLLSEEKIFNKIIKTVYHIGHLATAQSASKLPWIWFSPIEDLLQNKDSSASVMVEIKSMVKSCRLYLNTKGGKRSRNQHISKNHQISLALDKLKHLLKAGEKLIAM